MKQIIELSKEFWDIISDAPKEIGENLTPLGKWIIWIPVTIVVIILFTLLTIVFGILHLLNKVTFNFFPKQYKIVMGKLFMNRKYTDTCIWPYHMDIKYAGPITPANPKFWVDKYGNHPNPFTTITQEQVESKVYTPVNNEDNEHE